MCVCASRTKFIEVKGSFVRGVQTEFSRRVYQSSGPDRELLKQYTEDDPPYLDVSIPHPWGFARRPCSITTPTQNATELRWCVPDLQMFVSVALWLLVTSNM